MFGAKVNHFLQIRTNNVDIHKNFYQALPFGQSFLSAAVRIGFLAVRRAVFCALRCGGRSVAGSMGAVR